MEKTLEVAKYLYDFYFQKFNSSVDEMKMHKLMYFTQRESLMYNQRLLFDEPFLGWKYGPVLRSVREQYRCPVPFEEVSPSVARDTKQLVQSVVNRYGNMSAWSLSCLSHNEFSWKCSRKGLKGSDNGSVELSVNAMKVDATRELFERNHYQ